MKFGEMKRNTSNWSNFGMLLRRAGLTASAGLSCYNKEAYSDLCPEPILRLSCYIACVSV